METPKRGLISLWLDSATPTLWIALTQGDRLLVEHQQHGDNDHSKTLMPLLERLMREASLTVKDLHDITVGVGPGSYTGTRIGVVVAKTLAYALNIPLYKVSSLALLASSQEGTSIAAVDARRGYVFAGKYHRQENTLSLLEADAYTTLDTLQTTPPLAVVIGGKPHVLSVKSLRERVLDLDALAPTYLRLTQAENEYGH